MQGLVVLLQFDTATALPNTAAALANRAAVLVNTAVQVLRAEFTIRASLLIVAFKAEHPKQGLHGCVQP